MSTYNPSLNEEAPMAAVKPIPDGYPRVIPSMTIDGAAAAIEFYEAVLGTSVRMRMDFPDGKVGHAELQLGDSVLMVADEFPEMGFLGPKSVGGTPITISVYVDDVDAVFDQALAAGATELRAVENQFYGDRSGQFEDPFGHRWNVATHIEDVPEDEMMRRAAAMMSQG
jgi:PhnB protein